MKRRHFMTAAAAALPAFQLARAEQPRMTFGFSTYGMQGISTEDAVRILADIGYDTVEMTVWEGWDAAPENLNTDRRKAVQAALKERNLKLTSFMENLKVADLDADVERLKRAGELAHDLAGDAEIPVIQTTLGGGEWEEKKDLYLEVLPKWLEATEESGVKLAIKPHRGGGMSQPADAVWLIEQLGEPARLRICYDYSHYIFRDLSMKDTVVTALPYLEHVAIKDAYETEDGKVRFANPGEKGTIDYGELLGLLADGGYTGDICVEVSSQVWRAEGYEPITAAKDCYERLSPLFG